MPRQQHLIALSALWKRLPLCYILFPIIILLLLIVTFPACTMAQDAWFTSIPLRYNPSFAGSSGKLALHSHLLYQKQNDQNYSYRNYNFFQSSVAVDFFLPKVQSGVGLLLNYATINSRSTMFNSLNYKGQYAEVGLMLAPKISFKGKFTFSPSLQISYINTSPASEWNWQAWNSDSISRRSRAGTIGLTTGLLFNSNKFQFGISTKFRNNYIRHYHKLKLVEGFTIHLGYSFGRSDSSKFSFTPVICLTTGDPAVNNLSVWRFPSLLYLNFRYKKILFGASLSPSFMLGYQEKNWKFMVIYRPELFDHKEQNIQFSFKYSLK